MCSHTNTHTHTNKNTNKHTHSCVDIKYYVDGDRWMGGWMDGWMDDGWSGIDILHNLLFISFIISCQYYKNLSAYVSYLE